MLYRFDCTGRLNYQFLNILIHNEYKNYNILLMKTKVCYFLLFSLVNNNCECNLALVHSAISPIDIASDVKKCYVRIQF